MKSLPIHEAILNKDMKTVREMLEQDAETLEQRNVMGWTPLHTACYQGVSEAVALLLAYGAKRGVRDLVGRTPEDLAKELRHQDVLRLLGHED